MNEVNKAAQILGLPQEEVMNKWKFELEQKKSITSDESVIIKIKNLEKK